MLKKIEQAKVFLEKNSSLFRCPICSSSLETQRYSLICRNHHQFDLSKKGTLFFLKQGHSTEYSREMFEPRGRMIRSGMYQPVLNQILEWLEPEQKVLDVGCGEGSFLTQLQRDRSFAVSVGFDISKEGIYLASGQPTESFWCVADLTDLPFADDSFDVLLNIFTPSNYREFQRVLKSGGYLIKVIPESDYLKELRLAFFPEEANKQHYSNLDVKQKLAEKVNILQEKRINYVFQVPPSCQLDLLEMSPLEWSVTQERKQYLRENPLSEITVDVDVILTKF